MYVWQLREYFVNIRRFFLNLLPYGATMHATMTWLWQGGVLVAVGVLLRRALHMDASRLKSYNGLTLLSREPARIYDLVVRDLEIEATILGVALNEAIEERESGNNENAWLLVQLAASEWDRLGGSAVTLLSQMSKYLPAARLE